MNKILLTIAALLMFAAPAFAQAAAPAGAPATSNFTQWDLGTYFGLAAAVIAAIGALKKLFPAWISGKEPVLGFSLSYVLGIASKLFIPGSFKDVNWVIFLLSLLAVAAGAKFGHDYVLNQVVKGKQPDGDEVIKKAEGDTK